jgi:hypothetical protein
VARLDAADQLDRHPQEVLRRRLVQPGAAHDPWERQGECLVQGAAERGGDRTEEPLGKRREEGDRGHRR